jgi:hypothetical protein
MGILTVGGMEWNERMETQVTDENTKVCFLVPSAVVPDDDIILESCQTSSIITYQNVFVPLRGESGPIHWYSRPVPETPFSDESAW